MKRIFFIFLAVLPLLSFAQRQEMLLEEGWRFANQEVTDAWRIDYDDSAWQTVTVPHDWAIYGPFDGNNDRQMVAIEQDGETEATQKSGRTGGLPFVGVGWYRHTFDVPAGKHTTLVFDGAMSEARVYVNGEEVIFWPYGYNSFYCDVTPFIHADGRNNVVAVRLENRPSSSRWYPGAGLYRNVHLVTTDKIHIPVWGTHITTPHVEQAYAAVSLNISLENTEHQQMIRLVTDIIAPNGKIVATKDDTKMAVHDIAIGQHFIVEHPQLWSPETPYLYKARTRVYADGHQIDEYTTRFGIRSIEYVPDKGFFLNGQLRKFQGVCNHHDLGPLGAAINTAALRRQLTLLKDMGCDAIRTSHNMPAPELVELCDEMGFMMMVEPFDEWDMAKCENGYHRFFAEWAERDMINMVQHYRNNPSVVMWSIGNEVPNQRDPESYKMVQFLQDICHRLDPTRPVTVGIDQAENSLHNGFAATIDIPGFNYRLPFYQEAYDILPQGLVLGSETASTVSSRGVYKFPVELKKGATYDDMQSSGYDTEACWWSNIPDLDFAMADDYDWEIGQFVWTGFDYLGEPTPYYDNWPSHSSYFGIIDLASLPKDRYYLYRSVWNKQESTLHILPHWTWKNRLGQVTPVYIYTSYPEAELFINGKSQGRQRKWSSFEAKIREQEMGEKAIMHRYRLMWDEVKYEPGELKVVAYNTDGNVAETKILRTAGKPHHLELRVDRAQLTADGKDLAYITVSVLDKDGNLCPDDTRDVTFTVSGAGTFRAAANGDPTCLVPFQQHRMPAFAGQLTAIIQSSKTAGTITLQATAKGLKPASVVVETK
jgi:beta-galactosidase